MQLIPFLVVLIFIGVLLWWFQTYVTTIDANIKKFIIGIVLLFVIIWVFQVLFGVNFSSIRIGKT